MNRFWVGLVVGVLLWVASLTGVYFRVPVAKVSFAVLIASDALLTVGFIYAIVTGRSEPVRRALQTYPVLGGLVVGVMGMLYVLPSLAPFWLDM